MLDHKTLDELAERIQRVLPSGLSELGEDMRSNTREAIMGVLSRMDLVTREEFEVQATILARTRERLETLERQVAELERQTGH